MDGAAQYLSEGKNFFLKQIKTCLIINTINKSKLDFSDNMRRTKIILAAGVLGSEGYAINRGLA